MPYMAHGRWDHSIDNKGSGISDEGDMFLLPNGDCMEVGQMANPQGQIELYKEYWTGAPGERKPCVVARSDNGVIIRIGSHCQGIAKPTSEGPVFVERWLKSTEVDGEGVANWLKDWRSSTDADEDVGILLPCMWACDEQRKEGDEMKTRGVSWRIVEVLQ
jgi:Protein HRI1